MTATAAVGRGQGFIEWGINLSIALVFVCLFATFMQGGDPTSMFAVAAIPLVVALALKAPSGVAILYYLIAGFRLPEGLPFLLNLKLPFLFGAMTLLALAAHMLRDDIPISSSPIQLRLMAGFIVVASASVFVAPMHGISFQIWSDGFVKAIVAGIGIYLLIRTMTDLRWLCIGAICCGTLLAPFAIYHKLYGIGLVEGTRAVIAPGANSILADPNFSALVLLIPMGLALGIATAQMRKWYRNILFVAAAVMLVGVVATQSRGALIGTTVVLGLFLFKIIKSRLLIVMLAGACVVILVGAMGLSARSSGSTADLLNEGLDMSAEHRLVAWKAAFYMALANPLTGVGMGAFPNFFYYYTPVWIGRAMDVHSSWLLVLGEVGLVGFGFYMSALFTSAVSLIRSAHIAGQQAPGSEFAATCFGISVAMVSFFVTGSFVSSSYSSLVFGFVALSCVVERIREHDAGSGSRANPRLIKRHSESVEILPQAARKSFT